MNRREVLKNALDRGEYFKVVCGAGNESRKDVELITIIYTLAGATAIDVSSDVEIVDATKRGIEHAKELSKFLDITIEFDPFINVSVGLKGDKHIRKAQINSSYCTLCEKCLKVCPQKAICKIGKMHIIKERCIGCGQCFNVCEYSAITFTDKKVNFRKTLPECIDHGAETIELHASARDDVAVMDDWKFIDSLDIKNFISMCLDRSVLSNEDLIRRVEKTYEITGNRLIIQADGIPMGGIGDTYNITLQAIAIADIIQKSKIPVKILLSGGTNSRTANLANLCDVSFNGIAIGTYAREIIKKYMTDEIYVNMDLLEEAVKVASVLVKSARE